MNKTLIFLLFPLLLSIHLLLREYSKFKKGNSLNYLTLILSITVLLSSISGIILILVGIA